MGTAPLWASTLEQGATVQVRGRTPPAGPSVAVGSDASFDYPGRIRAVAWELRDTGQFRAFRAWGDRNGEGPNHSEFVAAVHALRAARLYGAVHVTLQTDNQLVAAVLAGRWIARQDNIRAIAVRAEFEVGRFKSLAVQWVHTREIRSLDRAAKSVRDLLREKRYLPRASRWRSSGPDVDAVLKWRTRWERTPRRPRHRRWGGSIQSP